MSTKLPTILDSSSFLVSPLAGNTMSAPVIGAFICGIVAFTFPDINGKPCVLPIQNPAVHGRDLDVVSSVLVKVLAWPFRGCKKWPGRNPGRPGVGGSA